jgi:hypothetical protein
MVSWIPHWFISFESRRLGFHSIDGTSGTHPIGFILLQSFVNMGVRVFICWLDLCKKLSPPIVLQFHYEHAPLQLLTAYFLVTSHGLILVADVREATITDPSSRQRGRYKITNRNCLQENHKEKEKLVAGPKWAPDTKTDWPTDCRS